MASQNTPPVLPDDLSDQEIAAADSIRTIVLPLGPYRNLTTLIGAIFSLHPQAVVLNHAATRLLPSGDVDFLRNCTAAVQRKFLQVSIRLLQDGDRGASGGSILKSHAFDDPAMRNLYDQDYGKQILKPTPRVLYWKDSHRIQDHLFAIDGGLERLFRAFSNVKLILPIRNPIDCAKSNLDSGHWRFLATSECATFDYLVTAILTNIRRLHSHPALTPDRFLMVWQPELTSKSLVDLCEFCGLHPDRRWMENVATNVTIKKRSATGEEKSLYAGQVDLLFRDLPMMHERLLDFIKE